MWRPAGPVSSTQPLVPTHSLARVWLKWVKPLCSPPPQGCLKCLQSACHPVPIPPVCLCASSPVCPRTCPAPLTASFPFPFPLAFSLSVSVFLFSRKSVRGKGKGQKRKRKKSRYKSWSAYVVPLPSHSPHRSLLGPQSNSHLQDPRAAPLLPRPLLQFSASFLPVSLSHSHSTNWHRGGRHGGGITGPGLEAGGWAEWACRIQGGGLWLGWGTAFSLTHWALVAGPCWHGCQARMPAHPTGFHCSRLPHFSGSWGAGWGG